MKSLTIPVSLLCSLLFAQAVQAVTLSTKPSPSNPVSYLNNQQGSPRANVTSLLRVRAAELSNDMKSLRGRSYLDVIGTGVCNTAMQSYPCNMGNHEQNRCVGGADNYDYCICAGGANGAGNRGLWLNTAWGPGCEACRSKPNGYVFDGTCNGDGTGGSGQNVAEILRTVTVEIIVVEVYPAATSSVTSIQTGWPTETQPTVTVTVTATSGGKRGGRVRGFL